MHGSYETIRINNIPWTAHAHAYRPRPGQAGISRRYQQRCRCRRHRYPRPCRGTDMHRSIPLASLHTRPGSAAYHPIPAPAPPPPPPHLLYGYYTLCAPLRNGISPRTTVALTLGHVAPRAGVLRPAHPRRNQAYLLAARGISPATATSRSRGE